MLTDPNQNINPDGDHELAVCMVTHNNYYETVYCIENLMHQTNVKLRFHIFDNASTDDKLIEYLKRLCKDNKAGYAFLSTKKVKLSEAINVCLKTVYEKYCALVPINVLVSKNWAEDLKASYNQCKTAGCISIKTGNEKTMFMPIMHQLNDYEDEKLLNVCVTENATVQNIMFFATKKLEEVGFIETTLQHESFELLLFCLMLSIKGYTNYYITRNYCIKINIDNETLFPKKSNPAQEEYKIIVENYIKNNLITP